MKKTTKMSTEEWFYYTVMAVAAIDIILAYQHVQKLKKEEEYAKFGLV